MPQKSATRTLSTAQRDFLINALKARFERHPERHNGVSWASVQARLDANPGTWWSLFEMERTGGEPDVVAYDKSAVTFYDCSQESPEGRRSLCYDAEGLAARKEAKPKSSALDMAARMGIEILSEEEYRELQRLGTFDTRTSSWIATPASIRKLGGALFADRRYGAVFIYHNGASSYYASRGFRGSIKLWANRQITTSK